MSDAMPTFMDRHSTEGLTAEDVARAHARDLDVQERFGVRFSTYLFDGSAGVTFCLVESPTRDAVVAAHTAAHGVGPEELIEVDPRDVELFLGPLNDPVGGAPLAAPGIRTIVFTDIVGSTANIDQLGDVHAMEIVLDHDRLVREQLTRFGGREVDHTGDGLMLSFASVSAALSCGVEIQRMIAMLDPRDPRSFSIRIGMAAGEPVQKDRRLFGAAVNMSARACSIAQPGEILVTNPVRDLAAGKGFSFVERGEFRLKGFARPVPVFAVDWASSLSMTSRCH